MIIAICPIYLSTQIDIGGWVRASIDGISRKRLYKFEIYRHW